MSVWRSRWAAIGAAVAVTLGAGGIGLVNASIGAKPVTVTADPTRILDTRVDLGLSGRFVNETPRDLQVTGEVSIAPSGTATVVPDGAVAVLVNVTVVNPDSEGFLSLRPGGTAGKPTTSTVNFTAGSIEPNAATVGLDPHGRVQVYVKTAAPAGTADVLVDVVGYTIDHTHDDRFVVPFALHIDAGQTVTIGTAGPISLELDCVATIGDNRRARILGKTTQNDFVVMSPGLNGTNALLLTTTPADDRVIMEVQTNVPWFQTLDVPGAILTQSGHYLGIDTSTLVGVNYGGHDCTAVGTYTYQLPTT